MPDSVHCRWHLGELPFQVGQGDTWSNAGRGLPDFLPFSLELDAATGLLRQAPNAGISEALEKAYQAGSLLTGSMDDHGIGLRYAEAHLKVLSEWVSLPGRSVLEIGCGNAFFLSLLRESGADVLGVEPGLQGPDGMSRYDIPVLHGFFPHPDLKRRFDVIVANSVVEHVEYLGQFLREVHNSLRDDGVFFISVPDVEPLLEAGDISCLVHEHWSYFTPRTLRNVLGEAGFEIWEMQRAEYGGGLCCLARKTTKKACADGEASEGLVRFRARAEANLLHLRAEIDALSRSGRTFGVYCPSRALNALMLLGVSSGFRFFDDNPDSHGLYYPGFRCPVESFEDMMNSPVGDVLIFSQTFSNVIKDKIAATLPETRIVGWSELVGQ